MISGDKLVIGALVQVLGGGNHTRGTDAQRSCCDDEVTQCKNTTVVAAASDAVVALVRLVQGRVLVANYDVILELLLLKSPCTLWKNQLLFCFCAALHRKQQTKLSKFRAPVEKGGGEKEGV